MDIAYTQQEEAFRQEVIAFLDEKLPAPLAKRVGLGHRLTKADMEAWHTILNEKKWLSYSWPVEFGGVGWNPVQRHIFEEECANANAPRLIPFGIMMLAPVLQKFGTKEQQDHFLPRILDGSDWWCQGYSEPGAGSDLAAVKTKAVRHVDDEGEHYIVNGQKTWTTLGQFADWIFCLVRTNTDVKKQRGISFLLIDMKTPGVTVRPIKLLDGECEVNEVFFDDVRVPMKNLVGEENMGWTYAKYLLTHERTNIAGVGAANASLDHLKYIAQKEMSEGKPLIENPYFAGRLAQIEIDLMAMTTTNLRMIAGAAAGQAPGAESSMLKVKGTIIRQAINDLTRRALGPYAMPFVSEALDEGYNGPHLGGDYAASVSPEYFNNYKLSIFGGSNEIQRTIISKSILGL